MTTSAKPWLAALLCAVLSSTLLSCASGAGSAAAPPEPAAPSTPGAAASVEVNVGTFRNTNGVLACRLYGSGEGFPMSPEGGVEQRVAIGGETTRCTFHDVAPGTYAVAVVHDENDNGKLDTNFFGAPIEGYGVSNNRTYAFSAPEWEESKFDVQPGKGVGLGIALRY